MAQKRANDINTMWLNKPATDVQIDPRQRFSLNSERIWSDVEKLEREIADLDRTLSDVRKIRNTCATLHRAQFK